MGGVKNTLRNYNKTIIKKNERTIEQLTVQLAGCSVAALGGGEEVKEGDYGWSPAYQDVLELRKKYESKGV